MDLVDQLLIDGLLIALAGGAMAIVGTWLERRAAVADRLAGWLFGR